MIYGVSFTIQYLAWDTANSVGKTGDASNHTLKWVKDGTAATPTNSPSEVDSTNLKGVYSLVLTSTEAQALFGTLGGVSSTSGIVLVPVSVDFQKLPNVTPGANGGLPTCDANNNIHGLTPGTGTGQLNPASGKVPSTLAAGDVSGNVAADLQTIKGEAVTCAAPVTVPATISSFAGGAVASVTGAVGSVTAGVTLATSQPNYAPALASVWTSDLAAQLGTNVDAAVSSRMQSLGSAVITKQTSGTADTPGILTWDFSANVDVSGDTQDDLTVNGQAVTALGGGFFPVGDDATDRAALDSILSQFMAIGGVPGIAVSAMYSVSVTGSVATIHFNTLYQLANGAPTGGPIATASSSLGDTVTVTQAGAYGTKTVQKLTIVATGGTFDVIDLDGITNLGTLNFDCTGDDASAFLSSAPTSITLEYTVTQPGGAGTPILIAFPDGGTWPLFTVDGSGLTGGTPASAQNVSATQTAITNLLPTNFAALSISSGGAINEVAAVTGAVGSVTAGVALTSTGLNAVLVDGKTVPQALEIIGATTASKVSGVGTGTETFKGLDGTTTRVVVTVDSSGNRTAVAYD